MALRKGVAFPSPLSSETRKLPNAKEQAFNIYRKTLHQGDRRGKLLQRTFLMEVVMNCLSELDPSKKFLYPEFGEIIMKTAEVDDKFDPFKAYQAFLALEYIVMLLVLYPWKYEFRTLKIYNGYFKVKISEYLRNVMCVFTKLGYQPVSEGCYQLQGEPDAELCTKVGFELFVCAMECKLILDIHRAVGNEDFSLLQVVRCRVFITGGAEDTVRWLRHNYKPSVASVRRENSQESRLKRERLAHSTPGNQSYLSLFPDEGPDSRVDSDYVKIKADGMESEKSPPYFAYHTGAYQAHKRMIGGSVKQYSTMQSSLSCARSGTPGLDDLSTNPLMNPLCAEAAAPEVYDIEEEGTIEDHLKASIQTLGSDGKEKLSGDFWKEQKFVGDSQKDYQSVYTDPNYCDNNDMYDMEQSKFRNVYRPEPIKQGAPLAFSKQPGLPDFSSQHPPVNVYPPDTMFEPVSLLSRGADVDWQNVPFMDKMPDCTESPFSSINYSVSRNVRSPAELLQTQRLSKSDDFDRTEQTKLRTSVDRNWPISELETPIYSTSISDTSLPASKCWVCVNCTLHNAIELSICRACGKTKIEPLDLRPVVFSRICSRCTYENKSDASVCTLCENPLEKYQTVV